jgi:hypothetical protein
MEITLEPGDMFAAMSDQEYAEFCEQFQKDRLLEDAQDYLQTLDEMNGEFDE